MSAIKCLLIEPNLEFSKIFTTQLSKPTPFGQVQIEHLSLAMQGIQLAEQNTFQMIIADTDCADMRGEEALLLMRDHLSPKTFLVLTGNSLDPETISFYSEKGINLCLEKSVGAEKMVHEILEFYAHHLKNTQYEFSTYIPPAKKKDDGSSYWKSKQVKNKV